MATWGIRVVKVCVDQYAWGDCWCIVIAVKRPVRHPDEVTALASGAIESQKVRVLHIPNFHFFFVLQFFLGGIGGFDLIKAPKGTLGVPSAFWR